MKIVECVPNFSEGRDRAVIDAIAASIEQVEQVRLLDVDPGEATNRTVVTFVGPPEGVLEAAFAAIAKASELIDMRTHSGAHARQGATDVCPFVPVSDVTMEECVQLARRLGQRVGEELAIPVYLYEEAATRPQRRALQDVRAGEYEGLADKLAIEEGAPDFGPVELNTKAGATAIGARKFLIAYNVNLNTANTKLAKAIAWRIRDTEGPVRTPEGKLLRDDQGKLIRRKGEFDHCKATGWFIEEYGRAQVTMNLTDWEATPIQEVFDACCRLSEELGVRVTGSEIVGLVPRGALTAAGAHYLRRQNASVGAPDSTLIELARLSLGLDEIVPFDPATKIVEETLRDPEALVERAVRSFADETSASTPVPGGGSVAALSAGLSGSLLAMVGNLSATAKGFESRRDEMGELAGRAQGHKKEMLAAVDLDSQAYDAVVRAMRLPRKTDDDKKARAAAIASANATAAAVPMSVLERTIDLLELARHLTDEGMGSSLSDAGVAAAEAAAAADGACYNVLINLPGLGDEAKAVQLRERALDLNERAHRLAGDIRSVVLGRLSS